MTRFTCGFKIKTNVATWGEQSPSVARPLSASEAAELAATALALPESWVLTIEPSWGQLSIHPRAEARYRGMVWVADPVTRRISHRNAPL